MRAEAEGNWVARGTMNEHNTNESHAPVKWMISEVLENRCFLKLQVCDISNALVSVAQLSGG